MNSVASSLVIMLIKVYPRPINVIIIGTSGGMPDEVILSCLIAPNGVIHVSHCSVISYFCKHGKSILTQFSHPKIRDYRCLWVILKLIGGTYASLWVYSIPVFTYFKMQMRTSHIASTTRQCDPLPLSYRLSI